MFKNFKSAVSSPSFIFGLIIYSSFLFHLYNIGYNSPSNDEATYIKTGLNAIYKNDWSLSNTATWYGGHPYFYPTITALAFSLGGIEGSRILNLLFSIICLFFVGNLTLEISRTFNKNRKTALTASYIAVVLVGFSEVMGYLSRLATLDMPSFTFLTASLYYLVKSLNGHKIHFISKGFIISSILLTLAFAFKYIVVIYTPIIGLMLYFYTKGSREQFWQRLLIAYFLIPGILLTLFIAIPQIPYLKSYIGFQLIRETSSFTDLFRVLTIETWPVWIFWLTGLVSLVIKKSWKTVLLFISFAASIALFHFANLRIATWDKHIFLIILPLCIMAGLGLSQFARRKVWVNLIIFLLLTYSIIGQYRLSKYNNIWPDYTNTYKFLEQTLGKSDTLLAEEASSILLNAQVTTFDWIEYKGQVGHPAYKEAIIDGHFTYIELTEGFPVQTQAYKKIETLVQNEARGSYNQVYKDDYFTVYKLKF